MTHAINTDSSDFTVPSDVIRLAKRWNNSPTEYNRTQFLEAFNQLRVEQQIVAVQKGSALSGILLGWAVECRMELETEFNQKSY